MSVLVHVRLCEHLHWERQSASGSLDGTGRKELVGDCGPRNVMDRNGRDGWPGQTTGDWRENLEETSELKASWWQGIRKTREV